MGRYLAPALILALIALPSSRLKAAAPVDPEQETVIKVNKSIDDGVQYLRRNWDAKTYWESFAIKSLTGMDGGITALATLAMLNSGVKATDPVVAASLEYLRKISPQKTYVVALVNLCLAETREEKDQPRLAANAKWLIDSARRSGDNLLGWSYPHNDDKNGRTTDASNTQYALLGLYAAKQGGVKIPDSDWKAIQKLYLTSQISESKDLGSWSYADFDRKPSFTMTTAGVCGLLIAGMGLSESAQQLDAATGIAAKCGEYPENEAVRKGMNWIGTKFSFADAEASKSLFYNVYGIERAGRLSGQRFLGKYDWYREGCEFLLKSQKSDGSWTARDDNDFKGVNVISTSFALLFLSKGKSPVLISKMAYGEYTMTKEVLIEKGDPKVVGWNRKHNDARNLTEFASKELFKNLPLGWQAYDSRRKDLAKDSDLLAEAGILVQSPILYITGHSAPRLTGEQKKLLKKYIEEGGFVIAEACCASKEFADGFRELLADKELFPNAELRPLPPEHAIWKTHFLVPPAEFKKLECLEVGCRTVLILSPEALSGYWEESKYMPEGGKEATGRGQRAFQLAANIIAYATGKEPPKQRLSTRKIIEVKKSDKAPPNGFVQPLQIKLDESPPADAAMRNLMGYLRDNAKLDVALSKVSLVPNDKDLFQFKLLYMHGKKAFDIDEGGVENIKANLQSGGILLADACCGSMAFDKSFRAFAEKMFPNSKLDVVPLDDVLYSEKLNGKKIELVERREKIGNATEGNDTGFERLPPKFEGIKVDGRWAILYSKYDLGCALENHKSTDCLGHTPDSARKLAAAAVLYSLKR